MIVVILVISAVMVDYVRVIEANLIGSISVCIVSFSSHALCWKLIRKEGNSWEHVHGIIITNGFPKIMVMKCQCKNALYNPVK